MEVEILQTLVAEAYVFGCHLDAKWFYYFNIINGEGVIVPYCFCQVIPVQL